MNPEDAVKVQWVQHKAVPHWEVYAYEEHVDSYGSEVAARMEAGQLRRLLRTAYDDGRKAGIGEALKNGLEGCPLPDEELDTIWNAFLEWAWRTKESGADDLEPVYEALKLLDEVPRLLLLIAWQRARLVDCTNDYGTAYNGGFKEGKRAGFEEGKEAMRRDIDREWIRSVVAQVGGATDGGETPE